jgi:hypothetical protein
MTAAEKKAAREAAALAAAQAAAANPLNRFLSDVEEIDRSNVIGTLADVRDDNDFTSTKIGQSVNHEGMYYVVLKNDNKRLVVTFSKALSKLYGKGEITDGMLLNCEVAIVANAAGEERTKLQLPVDGNKTDITDVKAQDFRRVRVNLAEALKQANAGAFAA